MDSSKTNNVIGRSRTRWALLTALLATVALTPAAAQADPPDYQGRKYKATADLDGRSWPTLRQKALSYVNLVYKHERVRVICQARGSQAYGSRIWDLVAHRDLVLYVPDPFIKTGTDGWAPDLRRCGRKEMKTRVIEPDYGTNPFDD